MNGDKIDYDVVILGGGFAGVYCAKALYRAIGRRPGTRIALVSNQNYMVFQPMLAEVAGGGLSPRHVVNPLRQLCRGIDVIQADVEQIDLPGRQLAIRAGHHSHCVTLGFDHLVLTLGAEIDLSRVPGMPEHALLMQNVGDAMQLHATVIRRLEEANLETHPHIRRRLLTFVIVGGGYSGVETAGQILDLLHETHRLYDQIDDNDYRVILVHSGDHILPTLSDKLALYAEDKLRKAGLKLYLNQRVKAITSNQAYLSDGTTIDTNTVVCTVGNAPHRLVRHLCESGSVNSERGRIVTDNTLAVPGQRNLWAAGDCASIPMKGGGYCPPTAQFAMRQGTLCGQNIAAAYDGKPTKPFLFTGLGELAAIGRRKAVAMVNGISLSGFVAWWMWRTVYLMKLPGIERKVRVMLDWTLDLFFRRDINLLNPESTEIVNNIHLEAGDRLFNAGDPPFSLYIVLRGSIDLLEHGNVVMTVGPGDFFGERALTKGLPYIYDAVAREPSELTSMDGKVFVSLVNNSAVLKRIFRRTANQYKTTEEITRVKERISPSVANRPAAEIMQRDLVTLRADTTLTQAASQIKAKRYSSYPVVDNDGKYLGTISREDLYFILKSSSTSMDTTVGTLDLSHLPTAQLDATASELIEAMLRQGSNKTLINNADGSLAGIVTLLDLLCESIETASP